MHPKAVLFVYDHQPQSAESDIPGEKSVGAYHHHGSAIDGFIGMAALLPVHGAGGQGHYDTQRLQHLA